MKRESIQRVIVFFILFLPLQYAFVGIMGVIKSEPWPALILPAFKSVLSTPDTITIDQVRFYVKDNKKRNLKEIQPQDLFRGIKKSQLQGFLRSHFFNAAATAHFNVKTREWLKNRIIEQNTSLNAGRLYIKWVKINITHTDSSIVKNTSKTLQHFSIVL